MNPSVTNEYELASKAIDLVVSRSDDMSNIHDLIISIHDVLRRMSDDIDEIAKKLDDNNLKLLRIEDKARLISENLQFYANLLQDIATTP